MNLMLITGNHARHNAFVEAVVKHHEPQSHIRVIREDLIPEPPEELNTRLKDLWELHFYKRELAEGMWFGAPQVQHRGRVCVVKQGHLNDNVAVQFVKNNQPDVVLILGVDIIREPLFSTLPAYSINLHMGLIPWYKGSITFFWPFYNLEPAMAGCSYHIIEELVDTGEILHQCVPEMAPEDGLHDVACKALLKSYEDVGHVLDSVKERIAAGVLPHPDPTLATRGKTYIKKDWKPQMLRLIYEVYGDHIAEAYLQGNLPQRTPKLKSLI